RAERATIGGVLATDASGALRLRFGPARDFTLGMRVVNAHGTLIKCGGKVVKNVAGYEMTKLYIGSLGTLALIAEATFKVFPKPQEEITFVAAFATLGDADATARTLWNLTTAPLALELFDSQIARGLGFETKASEWMIAARFGGTQSLARAALDKAIRAAKENNTREFAEARRASLWDDIANLPITLRDQNPRGAIVRVACAPARVCETIETILQCAHANSIEPKLFAHARAGIIHVGLDGEIEILKKTIAELRAARAPNPASVVIEAAPRALKEKISVWGEAGAAHFLNQRIKKQFDPQNIFNPGRFVGGL
ncbi:MAG: FAD-binding oxidoreductase, partial [Chloroflexi bacterium]|nr:FAD-binding oxidoreductase [Chloroflexota bacterium]